MNYSSEVEAMCPLKKGAYHGPAPIPQEGKWTQAKEVKDISGLTHGIGWCAPQQGTCKLTLNVKEGVIQEALVETIGCSGMTHSAAMYIAKRFDNTGAGLEDLVSIGTIGLIKAINTFQPDRNIKLATYASRCIENEILMYIRKHSGVRAEVSIDEPLNIDWDGNELLLSDVMGHAGEDSVLVTVQNHLNTIAVCTLVGIAVIVICHDRPVPPDMAEAAQREGVAIVVTPLSQYAAALALKDLPPCER